MLFWTGTATVENGIATVIVASGPALTAEVAARYSMAVLDGAVYFVDGLIDTGSLDLTRPYDGPDGTVPFEIWPVSPEVSDLVRLAQVLARTQAQINVLDRNSQGLFFNHIGVTGDADPGPGNLALDQSDPVQASEIYIDNLDANSAHRNVAQLLARFAVGTTIRLRSLASTAFYEFDVAGTTIDQGGWFKASLTYVGHDGVIGDGEPIALSWSRAGEGLDVGAAGSLAARATYDAEVGGFIYMSTEAGETVLYVKNSGAPGDWSGSFPLTGPRGLMGWSPRLAVVSDNDRRVLQLSGWVGGEGSAPAVGVGQYLGTAGLVQNIANAVDIRGLRGLSAYDVAVAAGFVGDVASWLASLVGPSAYQRAVANGFVGDEAAWLASLNGLNGTDPGIYYTFDEGTADANPGAGVLRANATDLTAATVLFVSKTNRGGDGVSAFLAGLTLSDSERKGTLVITRTGGNAQIAYDVIGATDAPAYVKVQVANGSGADGFLQNDALSFQFSSAGDRGTNGNGAGDVLGPELSVQDNLATYDGTSGKVLKDSGVALASLVRTSENGNDFANKRATLDNLLLKAADIASAAAVNLNTATGHTVTITGTTATTSVALASGKWRLVRAAAAWPITVGANLVLSNGGGNYVCAPGDMILFVGDGAVVRGLVFPAAGSLPADNSITNAKLADMATARLKGRVTAGSGDPEDLTAAQVWSVLGMVPAASVPETLARVQAYRQGNILGSVAETGGIPSGALFETGSNANGWYVRLPDGTQICQVSMAAGTWTFPAAFVSNTSLSVMGNAVAASVRIMCAVNNLQNTIAGLITYDTNPTNNRTGHQAYWIAIGRWF